MNILVVGSINMDIVNRVVMHPLPGETVKGLGTMYAPGGKGANQAVAAALAGGQVKMLGAVGKDPFSLELVASLENANVDTSEIIEKEGTAGMAFITVDESGENTIILSEGSNALLSIKDVEERLYLFEEADILLLQNEVLVETTLYVLKEAARRQVQTYFNPAPALVIPNDVFSLIDFLILNETEIEVVTGIRADTEKARERAINWLIEMGVKAVILTLGAQGSSYFSKKEGKIVTTGFTVNAVDTTAAGDTFIGSFAAAKAFGKDTKEALVFATAASAITVTREGAQHSIPLKKEIDEFLAVNH
ncbi:ribokinase [Neobacillus jeddahensis]|uniref:ribokinase n=1 Tax=Neobacillus jeddahensis TaxID=1461580 RepID=UPI00058C50EE|nr:ribokinase [Neobacillus jeddahensis]